MSRLLQMAKEWARELGSPRYRNHELLVAEVVSWGFNEVEGRGRNPDVVLKEMLKKIDDGLGPVIDLAPAREPDAGDHDRDGVDAQSSEPHRVGNGERGVGEPDPTEDGDKH